MGVERGLLECKTSQEPIRTSLHFAASRPGGVHAIRLLVVVGNDHQSEPRYTILLLLLLLRLQAAGVFAYAFGTLAERNYLLVGQDQLVAGTFPDNEPAWCTSTIPLLDQSDRSVLQAWHRIPLLDQSRRSILLQA